VARKSEPKRITISDPKAIRALAHPARLKAIEELFEDPAPKTATELGDIAGVTPSAMSYHLRLLERYGLVRRLEWAGDARMRPWVRGAADLSVALRGSQNGRVGDAAIDTLLSAAMESDRNAIVAAQRRRLRGDKSVPLDAVTRYLRAMLVLTVPEARKLLKDVDRLYEPYLVERRKLVPDGASRFELTMLTAADLPERPTNRARAQTRGRNSK
jgi:DNA-binding transcriptional ArsR family regulator